MKHIRSRQAKKWFSISVRVGSILIGMIIVKLWFTTLFVAADVNTVEDVIWTQPVRVAVSGNSLQKNFNCDGCQDAGAISVQKIERGDGYVQFSAGPSKGIRFIGLGNDLSASTAITIPFAVKFGGTTAEVREKNIYKKETEYLPNDVFKITLESGVIKYYKNGVLWYKSSVAPQYPLVADTALLSNDSTMQKVVISYMTQPTVDAIGPEISLSIPSGDATISSIFSATALAKDPIVSGQVTSGVQRVEVLVDGILKTTVLSSGITDGKYPFTLDTKSIPNGKHVLSARAYDIVGNTGASSPAPITILNSATPLVNSPELPRSYIDSSFPVLVVGHTIWNVATDCAGLDNCTPNLQNALDAARPGDEVVVKAGDILTGNFVLPAKDNSQGKWIVVRSSLLSNMQAGTRVAPTNVGSMPKLVSNTTSPALRSAPGAAYWRLSGLEITTTHAVRSSTFYEVVNLGTGNEIDSSILPHHIVIDRSYIHGTSTGNIRRGIALNGISIAVIDSYISDIHEIGADSQAIAGWNGPGPFKIVNNYLEASGENVLFGGADPRITNLVPSDIEFRHNYLSKPTAWFTTLFENNRRWTVKNIFELKNAQRVVVDGNIMENNWPDGQNGTAVLLTVRNQNGGCTWCGVGNVTYQYNRLRNVASGISILGIDYNHPSQQTTHVAIVGNVFEKIDRSIWSGGYGASIILTGNPVNAAPSNIIIDHNDFLQAGHAVLLDGKPFYGVTITNNIFQRGCCGLFGSGAGEGNTVFSAYLPDAIYNKNVMIGARASLYSSHSDNFFPIDNGQVGFADYSNGDYQLAPSSPYINAGTDGKNLGADIPLFLNSISGVTAGN